ncbi:MAG: protein translocase subunit SecDF [Saprospiraceae bacterium]|nr:protein translocase subunit SecDF [Saprospiraceae bacterium]
MQGKGFIKVIAVVLILLSAYQLLFTWKANQVEKKADDLAKKEATALNLVGDDNIAFTRRYRENYLDSLYEEPVFLNFFKYKTVKQGALKLGLDLKGGMSVVLEADIPNLIKNLSGDSKNQAFLDAIAKAKADQENSQEEFVDLFVNAFGGTDAQLASIFQSPDNDEELGFNASKEKIRDYLKKQAEDAFQSTYDIIQSRIDQTGLSSPNIQRQQNTKRIIIEMPGVENPEAIRKLIVAEANLEFYEMYVNTELTAYLEAANEAVKNQIALENPTEVADEPVVEPEEEEEEEATILPETSEPEDSSENQTLEELLGEGETVQEEQSRAEILKDFPLTYILNPTQFPSYELGFVRKIDTPKVNDYLKMEEVQTIFPQSVRLFWGSKAEERTTADGEKVIGVPIYAMRGDQEGNPQMDGGAITNATQDFDQRNNPSISMTMNQEGALQWEDLTRLNVDKPIAIVLDDKVYSFPTIQNVIAGGRSSITGKFSVTEAQDLATVIKTGKLDVPAKIIEEAIVGPTLGKKNIRTSLLSLLVGLGLVLVFMALYYGKAGWIADLALLFNLFLVIGILAATGATLTLPGIAGLVLTIGMAVDANVIIFERVREELAKGKELFAAVRDGYKASYSAIIDANVTTLIIAALLLIFGIGPIKGFGTVLAIGILTSLFTGVLFTRVIKDDMLVKKKHISYWTKTSEKWFRNLNFDFLSKRKLAYVISGIIVFASLANLIARGTDAFDLGVDLSGGRSYTVKFDQAVQSSEVKSILDEAFPQGTSTVVRTFGSDDQLKITTSLLTKEVGEEIDAQAEETLYNALKSQLGADVSLDSFKKDNLQSRQRVDATIADDLRSQARWLTLLALGAIFLYLLARFLKWQYGLAAVVTLAHDTLVLLGIFSLFRSFMPFALEVDQAFIAALLTVIGYSINDTVVVFDRIREYLRLYPKKPYKEVINAAINSTLSRTLITSLTTLIVLLFLFIFGGEVIKGFAFALLIGVIVGTYSSIFVATPIVVDLYTKGGKSTTK